MLCYVIPLRSHMLSVLENPPENSIYPLKRQEKNASEIVC